MTFSYSELKGGIPIDTPNRILFLCPHGAAKSVIAAAYCGQEAARRNLAVTITSAGTEPDDRVPEPVIAALRAEGVDVSQYRPRHVTREELTAGGHIVSLGCDLGDLAPGVAVEQWNDVPPVSEDITAACAVIRSHVTTLLDELGRN